MKEIKCPQVYYEEREKSIFLAGGISNCPDWQEEMVKLLKISDLTLINPRREDFIMNDLKIEEEQITWEFEHLKKSGAVLFWFPKETLCPITLYELGKQSMPDKPIFIGIEPEYKRQRDVEIQTRLARPEIKIVYSLKDLSEQVLLWEQKSLKLLEI